MGYYRDIREYLTELRKRDKLVHIKTRVDKDTELMPLVRLQYLGLPEQQRKAFLFDNIVDSRGAQYRGSVVVGALAGSSEIYAIGMMCKLEDIEKKRVEAQRHPVEPVLVKVAPVQEEVHAGGSLLEHGGLGEFPVPICTPGFDGAPVLTAPSWVTRDPDNGIRNVGTYRAMIKSPARVGLDWAHRDKGSAVHWQKYKQRGMPMPAAIVIGGPPSLGYVSVTRYPNDVDELAIAGGIAGEAMEVVKCRTVDLEVPAHAEIVIEGEVSTRDFEPEGPFGESIGFMCLTQPRPYLTVTCITHRRYPVWLALISQFQPSESSKVKQHGGDAVLLEHLKHRLGMQNVLDVAVQETSDAQRFMAIRFAHGVTQEEVWRALEAAAKRWENSKIVIGVDEDVDPRDPQQLIWALSLRFQPHRDSRIITRPSATLIDLSLAPMDELERLREEIKPQMPDSSVMLMNATMKWPYPPVALPRKEYMEKALERWKKEGLPELNLREIWWGYELGCWSEEERVKAARALKGEHYTTGDLEAKKRKPV